MRSLSSLAPEELLIPGSSTFSFFSHPINIFALFLSAAPPLFVTSVRRHMARACPPPTRAHYMEWHDDVFSFYRKRGFSIFFPRVDLRQIVMPTNAMIGAISA